MSFQRLPAACLTTNSRDAVILRHAIRESRNPRNYIFAGMTFRNALALVIPQQSEGNPLLARPTPLCHLDRTLSKRSAPKG